MLPSTAAARSAALRRRRRRTGFRGAKRRLEIFLGTFTLNAPFEDGILQPSILFFLTSELFFFSEYSLHSYLIQDVKCQSSFILHVGIHA